MISFFCILDCLLILSFRRNKIFLTNFGLFLRKNVDLVNNQRISNQFRIVLLKECRVAKESEVFQLIS